MNWQLKAVGFEPRLQSFIYLNLVKNRSGLVRGVYTSLRAGNIREIWTIQGHGMDAGGM